MIAVLVKLVGSVPQFISSGSAQFLYQTLDLGVICSFLGDGVIKRSWIERRNLPLVDLIDGT